MMKLLDGASPFPAIAMMKRLNALIICCLALKPPFYATRVTRSHQLVFIQN